MRDAVSLTTPTSDSAPPRRIWTSPLLKTLPKLTDLTLASAIGGGGGTSGGGSTVFGLLFALVTLAGCSAERGTEPSNGLPAPVRMQAITCQVIVATSEMACAAPQRAPGREILGGQGSYVVLRSSNVTSAAGTFSVDVTVQNLGAQPIGTPDGTSATGIYVFFQSGPTVTASTGPLQNVWVDNPANTGDFTGTGQPYFEYLTLLGSLEESSPVTWQFGYEADVTTFAFTVLVAADVPELGGVLHWSPVAGMEDRSISFRGIAANSPTDVMAIGGGSQYFRRSGAVWTSHAQTIRGDLRTLMPTGAGTYLGIGSDGSEGIVGLFKGSVWNVIGSFPNVDLSAVTSVPNYVIVGGWDYGVSQAFIAIYFEGSWETWQVPGISEIVAIGWMDPLAPYLITANGDIVSWDGFGWSVVVGSTALSARVNTILMLDPGVFYYGGAVDRGGPDEESFVAFFDGTTVDTLYVGPAGETMALLPTAATGNVLAQVYGQAGFFSTYTLLREWNGTSWTTVDSVSGGYPPMAWAGGAEYLMSANNGVLSWEGSGLDLELGDPFTDVEYNGIAAVGNHVYVATEAGEVLTYDGSSWSTEAVSGSRIEKFWAIAPNDVYAGGADGMYHFDGATWTHLPLSEVGSNIEAMWGSGTTIFAAKTDTVFVRSGGVWIPHEVATGQYFRAIWGTGPTDVYAVGYPYGLMHFDGVTWSDVPLPARAPGDSSFQMMSIGGTSGTDIWMGTDMELAFHFDGAAIADYTYSGMSTIGSILATGPGTAYLGGDGIYRATATGSMLPVSYKGLRGDVGMVRTADGRIWSLGSRGLSVATR